MAYNNGYPTSYTPYPQQYLQQYPLPQPQNQNANVSNMLWVQGEAGAKAYLVAPNTTVQLWDSERQTIYLKSADASGMPSIKTLDYTIRNDAVKSPIEGFQKAEGINVSQNDFNSLQAQINALRDDFEAYCRKESRNEPALHGNNEAADGRK